ncbi:putative AP-5 complex subunit zeta-1 [Triplophysa rosa]|uniref:AP-5 complex subunit zeta-1 n=1 Tax=Triplophysa rosa TaxID=992332 RepID=A0A9W7TQB1_TRIRA|nr:putative AP-5 complex subunit zeta-1 [Triplophysa rosa]
MYSAATESLIKQAREIKEDELQKFYGRVFKLLHSKDQGGDTVDSLQRLHLILSATKYSRELPSDLVMKLQTVLCSSCPEQLQVLSCSILREIFLSVHSLCSNVSQDSRTISYVASIALSQAGNKEEVMPLCHHLLKSLESRLSEGQMSKHTLPILSKMISVYPDILTDDQVNLVSRKMVDWLRYASMQQGASVSSGGFFSGPRTRQPAPLMELDGVVTGDFFTVLCVGQSYTEDQWMNMYAFSMIRSWLLTYDTGGTSNAESDDRSEVDSSVMSMVSATSSSSRLLPPKERLREKTFEYCQRLIEQSDRKALKKTDTELQKACIVESVSIMDIICGEDPSYVYRAFPCIKALYGRLNGDLAYSRTLIPIAQFYLNHSEMAAVDSEAVFRQLFGHCPTGQFNEPMLAFEFIQFCLLNASTLQARVTNYRHSFPNLLKFLAWNSPGLISEFVELLPSLLAPDTAIELLHTILDLPCLAAALDLQHRSACYQASDRTLWDQQGVKVAACLDAFRQPFYRGLFLYILRPEAGTGDTIDRHFIELLSLYIIGCRLRMLHEILADMADSPRVVRCAQVIPVLLHVYFNTVTQISDEKLMNQLMLVLLERSGLLYNIRTFHAEVQRVFSTHLQTLCKLHPSLIVDQSRELLDFVGSPSNIYSKEDFYTHVVWVIGEYLSVSYDTRCSVELITSFFESLEAVLFEITQVRQSASPPSFSPRLITVLMTTLAKLATRSQDLIPRVSLFLSKMRLFARSAPVTACYSEEDSEEIITRAHELINLLKLPNVAQFVLAPSAGGDGPRWHRDTNTSLPQSMRTISTLLHRHSSVLPT